MYESNLCTQAEVEKAALESSSISKMSSGNTSFVFNYLKNLKEGVSIPPTVHLHRSRESVSSKRDKATLLNKYFLSMYTSSSYNSAVECNLAETNFADITTTEVYDELMVLDITKVKCIDRIGPLLLKHCTLALYQYL